MTRRFPELVSLTEAKPASDTSPSGWDIIASISGTLGLVFGVVGKVEEVRVGGENGKQFELVGESLAALAFVLVVASVKAQELPEVSVRIPHELFLP